MSDKTFTFTDTETGELITVGEKEGFYEESIEPDGTIKIRMGDKKTGTIKVLHKAKDGKLKDRGSFILFESVVNSIRKAPKEKQLDCFYAVCDYGFYGIEPPENAEYAVAMTVENCKPTIKNNDLLWLRNSKNAQKAGAKKKNAEADQEHSDQKEPEDLIERQVRSPSKPINEAEKRELLRQQIEQLERQR